MKTLVIYESMFGNTRDVALAIAEGVSEFGEVETQEVGEAWDYVPVDVDLLIVGGPTHQFGMSRGSSREMARSQTGTPLVSQSRGIREWLADLAPTRTGTRMVTFDTTLQKPAFLKYMGRASRRIHKGLKRKGFTATASPESFWVISGNGPLAEGEKERARAWAAQLAKEMSRNERQVAAVS